MKQTLSVNDLFELLRAACKEQFGFNPTQVSAGMRYMGLHRAKEHRFRDTGTHSQIILNEDTGKARLVKKYEGRPYWDGAELDYYCQSDVEIKEARDREAAKSQAAANAPLFLKHAPYLRSLYRGHPEYKDENPTPRAGAELLVREALDAGDPDAQSFAGAIGTREVQSLAHWLLEPIGKEHLAQDMQRIRDNPTYGEALQCLVALRALPDDAPEPDVEAEEDRFNELAKEVCRTTSGSIFMSFVYFALTTDAKALKQVAAE